jgi:D-alanyl-D-alanine dipeptidase
MMRRHGLSFGRAAARSYPALGGATRSRTARTLAAAALAGAVACGAGSVPTPASEQAGGEDVFRIAPLRPVAELRAAALAAEPPPETGPFREVDLVEVRSLDPTIRYDIRYATDRNFMGEPFYTSAHAYLQRDAAEALVRAHRALAADGFGILVHDAYRPWHVTRMFWDATPPELRDFVANPADGSRHNRGAAADVTLYDLATGEPVAMPSGYDEFTERAAADYPGGTDRERRHRALLREALEAEGFAVLPAEWWHFDFRDWRAYPILNLTFEELARGAASGAAPPESYVEAGACPYECCIYREWLAHDSIPVYAAESDASAVAFQLAAGERFQALTGNVHLQPTGVVVVHEDIVRPSASGPVRRFAAGDTLYVLAYQGEGFFSMWHRGRVVSEEMCWGRPSSPCELVREPEQRWWVRARNGSGEEGWIDMEADALRIGQRDACSVD